MNYFELYELPVNFLLDEKSIKEKYLVLSRKFHPDFYTSATVEKQLEILQLSTENNKAFQTLRNFGKRMKYILMEKGYLLEEEKYSLPQLFLMEMMDLNEILMDVQMDHDPTKKLDLITQLEKAEKNLFEHIQHVLSVYTEEKATESNYMAIKEFYYKRKYLLRIREQLDKFASP